MKTLYFDCFSGISGDMTIGALLDAGGDFESLQKELSKMEIDEEYELKVSKVMKNGIHSTKFDVILKHDHSHDHDHEDHGDHHGHAHRTYKDIVKLIESATFSEKIKNNALNIFKMIGKAEGKIHNLPLNKVHFHEVGAVDSIIDIVGTAILIEQLEIESIISSTIPLGSGKINIDHGIYPVPAPATLEVLKERRAPLQESSLEAELTTPTGAGIIAALTKSFKTSFPSMMIDKIGYGAGTISFPDHPNVLRIAIGTLA